jgi:hypothetical protein
LNRTNTDFGSFTQEELGPIVIDRGSQSSGMFRHDLDINLATELDCGQSFMELVKSRGATGFLVIMTKFWARVEKGRISENDHDIIGCGTMLHLGLALD